ncbi:MAG: NifU family protein [bacterium]|nr:NifU family protein [bacterium]
MTNGHQIDAIKQALEQIRPSIQRDGGDVRLVKFQDGIVYLSFLGACVNCPLSAYTLKFGVEQAIKEQVPDVLKVVIVEHE